MNKSLISYIVLPLVITFVYNIFWIFLFNANTLKFTSCFFINVLSGYSSRRYSPDRYERSRDEEIRSRDYRDTYDRQEAERRHSRERVSYQEPSSGTSTTNILQELVRPQVLVFRDDKMKLVVRFEIGNRIISSIVKFFIEN